MFIVLPVILPFSFGEEDLNLDDSVSAVCSVTKGDLPLKIWFTFKGEDDDYPYNLTTNDGIIITRNTQKISMIAIEAVKARHRGNYTCFASNKAGAANHTSYLAINGSKSYFSFLLIYFRILQFDLWEELKNLQIL